jgi:hypothetical protein
VEIPSAWYWLCCRRRCAARDQHSRTVLKDGSQLCAPNYRQRYRPAGNAKDEDAVQNCHADQLRLRSKKRYHTARAIGQHAAQPQGSVARSWSRVACASRSDECICFAAAEAEVTQWLDPLASWVEDLALAVIVRRLRTWVMVLPQLKLHLEKQRAERYLARNDVVASGSCSALSFGSSHLRKLCCASKVWQSPNVPWRRLEFCNDRHRRARAK